MDFDLGYNQARSFCLSDLILIAKGGYILCRRVGKPDGPYAWGYCFVTGNNKQTYFTSTSWPCAPGKQYYGRGPIQLTQ